MNSTAVRLTLALVFASLGAGCNSAGAPAPEAGPGSGPGPAVHAQGMKLPEGANCSASISRYRSVMDNDVSTGNVEAPVYNKIQVEIGEAERACASGQDARAVALIRASRARHGYPAG